MIYKLFLNNWIVKMDLSQIFM